MPWRKPTVLEQLRRENRARGYPTRLTPRGSASQYRRTPARKRSSVVLKVLKWTLIIVTAPIWLPLLVVVFTSPLVIGLIVLAIWYGEHERHHLEIERIARNGVNAYKRR